MIIDKVVNEKNRWDIYTEDQGWTNFLNSLSYFYAGKASQLPIVKVHYPQQTMQARVKQTIEDLYTVDNEESFASDLIKFYGVTNDINECGYILQDGSCLDFSARHLKYGLIKWEYQQGRKGLTHDAILGINNNGYCLTNDYRALLWDSLSFTQAIMNHCKAVRVGVGYEDIEPFIQVVSPLTEQQIQVIAEQLDQQKVIADCITSENLPVFDTELVVSIESLRNFNNEIINHGIK